MSRPSFVLCSFLLASGGCSSANESSGTPSAYPGTGGTAAGGTAGTGGATAGGTGGGTGAASGACSVTFTFTTVDNNGRYSPDNVSAVWVTDPSGAFVRTLEENGRRRQTHLGAWMAVSGGNTVDAVTGATDRAPREHTATWDCTALDGTTVAPGTYTMFAEFTTSNTGGTFGPAAPLLQVPFDVGAGGYVLSPSDQPLFVGITLTMQ